ncbi:MAG: hypothetical protein A2V66_02600 [Ignavibacteria bacterium RBG_13_36_8]|nr:MAG: hypothetical protein A2V66_02600 [Ignavibacteria bacterium RBG_13_36_8]
MKKYDYFAQDSVFKSASYNDDYNGNSSKNIQKSVDSEQELLDFRTDKINSGEESSENILIPKVNINIADVDLLKKLPGIGAVTAQKIIELRNERGGFKSVEELMLVKGIGEAKFKRIKEYIFIE